MKKQRIVGILLRIGAMIMFFYVGVFLHLVGGLLGVLEAVKSGQDWIHIILQLIRLLVGTPTVMFYSIFLEKIGKILYHDEDF